MATIAVVNTRAGVDAAKQITKTELTGADDLAFTSGVTQLLVLENTGASTPTINISGDAATTARCAGLGDPIDVSGGFDIALTANGTAGDTVVLALSDIAAYLADANNTPAVTGGTADVNAYIISR